MTKVIGKITNKFESMLECDYNVMKVIILSSSKYNFTCVTKGQVHR